MRVAPGRRPCLPPDRTAASARARASQESYEPRAVAPRPAVNSTAPPRHRPGLDRVGGDWGPDMDGARASDAIEACILRAENSIYLLLMPFINCYPFSVPNHFHDLIPIAVKVVRPM